MQRIRHTLGNGIEAPGLRDDAATVELPGGASFVVSVDSVVDGVHFDLDLCRPADVGWKALMGALSDLAAMGARPLGALVALCVPAMTGTDPGGELAVEVMEGVADAARESGCPVVGGDVSASRQLMVAVTVLGTVGTGVAVPRSGARAGDTIWVSGPCGGSAAGLRVLRAREGSDVQNEVAARLALAYRRPVARLSEGELARRSGAHAMVDISDGLALDLHRLADASGVGVELDQVPVAEGATLAEALGGGEDYELLVVIGPGDVDGYLARGAAAGLRAPWRIGVVTDRPEERRLNGAELPRLGWQHLLG